MTGPAVLALIALLMQAPPMSTRTIDAHAQVTLSADVVPRLHASELRPQFGTEITLRPATRLTMRFDGVADGLVADRGGRVTDGSALVRDAYIETHAAWLDVRAGYGRLVWGRLDEIAPTDVINPLDAATFLFDGRRNARLPVAFVRARVTASERLRVEGVLAPRFRRGVFDRLDEDSSPFNLAADPAVPPGVAVAPGRVQIEPGRGWRDVSGGARVETTRGRVDASFSAYRGFDGLGPIAVVPIAGSPRPAAEIVEVHPRFTMVGGDVESVSGPWAIRGEAAVFVERSLLSTSTSGLPAHLVPAKSFDAGAGFDRRVGAWRVYGSTVLHREWAVSDPTLVRTDVNIVASGERSFRAERHHVRGFVVVNPADASAFLRGLWTWKVRDNVTVDASAGVFLGSSTDTIGRFSGRNFVLTRTRYDF